MQRPNATCFTQRRPSSCKANRHAMPTSNTCPLLVHTTTQQTQNNALQRTAPHTPPAPRHLELRSFTLHVPGPLAFPMRAPRSRLPWCPHGRPGISLLLQQTTLGEDARACQRLVRERSLSEDPRSRGSLTWTTFGACPERAPYRGRWRSRGRQRCMRALQRRTACIVWMLSAWLLVECDVTLLGCVCVLKVNLLLQEYFGVESTVQERAPEHTVGCGALLERVPSAVQR